ncbi:DUF1320 domain-containing protein [Blastochloris tepida]|uniref:Mu-like prophage FluMu protein gp36 n=1 Tax=Blastochloris tepida TaxID=2233851 RepID=A0A348FYH9_9HYPH|nr:DUF1320 domain-containing protein [Blastochloris tepida]BBF92362.1 hypothetical protein BLTE_10470 [Blastochloris tepida]
MTTYASRADIESLYGPDFLAGLQPEGADLDAAVARAAADADAEIDAYVGQRHTLPLAAVPPILKACAIDIAVYRLANTWDRLTDEIRRRYDDRVKLLARIADGKASAGIIDPSPGGESVGGATSPDGAAFVSRPRRAW